MNIENGRFYLKIQLDTVRLVLINNCHCVMSFKTIK